MYSAVWLQITQELREYAQQHQIDEEQAAQVSTPSIRPRHMPSELALACIHPGSPEKPRLRSATLWTDVKDASRA